jgi:hypothetical protein
LKKAVARLAKKETPNQYRDAIKNAIFTAPEHWPAETAKKLEAIIGKLPHNKVYWHRFLRGVCIKVLDGKSTI